MPSFDEGKLEGWYGYVATLCKARLHTYNYVEDFTQEIMVKLWLAAERGKARFKGEDLDRGWVTAVVMNHLRDYFRSIRNNDQLRTDSLEVARVRRGKYLPLAKHVAVEREKDDTVLMMGGRKSRWMGRLDEALEGLTAWEREFILRGYSVYRLAPRAKRPLFCVDEVRHMMRAGNRMRTVSKRAFWIREKLRGRIAANLDQRASG